MASMSKTSGRYVLQFTGADKRRRTVRLGKIHKRAAETIKGHVEEIVSSAIGADAVADGTSAWLRKIRDKSPVLYDKLAAVGLAAPRERAGSMLGAWLDSYIDGRNVKGSTLLVWGHVRRNLVKYFGADKPLAAISPGDADQWRLWLATHEDLADNTIRRRCGRAKEAFRAAVRSRLILENPFADMKGCSVKANRSRDYFIDRAAADKIFTACPNAEWRLIFALSRYGGLRCPSEHLALSWDDVNWDLNRFTVHSPKTAHHEGGESRIVPLFPELRPYLEAAFDEAPERATHVIRRYRDAKQNLRTQFTKIIGRAGLTPWPKLFQNLRASRATELAAEFPAHVAAAWLGHSMLVAQKHYLQITDADYAKAAGDMQRAAKSDAISVGDRPKSSEQPEAWSEEAPAFPGVSTHNDKYTSVKVAATGLEPVTPAM